MWRDNLLHNVIRMPSKDFVKMVSECEAVKDISYDVSDIPDPGSLLMSVKYDSLDGRVEIVTVFDPSSKERDENC